MISTTRLLAAIALVCVILSFVVPSPFLLPAAIVLLCLALII